MKMLKVLAAAAFVSSMASCVTAPFVPPVGAAYADIKAPLDLDYKDTAVTTKTGRAEAFCILGLVSWGDCSTKTAAAKGQLKTISNADYEFFNVIGVYQKTTVVVEGE
ncbi:MAG: hypothetical protein RL095_2192 [Verrucomicrobiota bacterium]|jgi:hypothetical protein